MNEFLNKIICGDAKEELEKIPDESIDCVLTSPPYYALRDYQIEGQIGLEPTFEMFLEHLLKVFKEIKRVLKKSGSFWLNMGDLYCSHSIGEGNVGRIEGKRKDKDEQYKKAISAMKRRFDKFKYGGKNKEHCGRARGCQFLINV